MTYKPTFASFCRSSLTSLSPALTTGVITFFVWEDDKRVFWLLLAAAVTSLFFMVPTVFVHVQRLFVDEKGIRQTGLLIQEHILWADVVGALLRQRKNLMSRTDHLLIITSKRDVLRFNTSTLSNEDEERLLAHVRQCTNLIVEQDRPSV